MTSVRAHERGMSGGVLVVSTHDPHGLRNRIETWVVIVSSSLVVSTRLARPCLVVCISEWEQNGQRQQQSPDSPMTGICGHTAALSCDELTGTP